MRADPVRIIMNEADIGEGLAALARLDPALGPIIAAAGPVPLRRAAGGWAGLAQVIIGQQVSVASAQAIWRRVTERFPELDAQAVCSASEVEMRACGLSGPKIRALRAAALAALAGRLDLEAAIGAPDQDVRAMLTAVSGIGPWTADIYLIIHLGRPDVFAPGDLALQEAARIGLALPARPDARAIAALAERWSPWRAVAARLLWAYYARLRQREGVAR
ncbi:MAG: DNA-3-methyladenine glycosylase 2 family protein [Bosea sp.]|jgi:DNA-3-methyladenine glycosylase II|nr:DNA-3-methyladenine glycosylase 2 family protein [Bosea sp. (in: a-proteobacteria)]